MRASSTAASASSISRPSPNSTSTATWSATPASSRPSRLGGDEFGALLPEVVDAADAERVAARILEQMRKPIMIGLQECFVTASVGIALFPRDGATVADLLRNSDIAMYSVKSAGRNSSS